MAMPDFSEEVRRFVLEANAATQATVRSMEARSKANKAKWLDTGKAVAVAGLKTGALSAVGTAISTAVPEVVVKTGLGAQVAHAAAGVGVHITGGISPIMWAAKPWTGAMDVRGIAFALEKVYAVMDEDGGVWVRKYRCQERYACTCASRRSQAFVVWNSDKRVQYGSGAREPAHKDCQAVRNFLVAQKEAKAAKIAINATVVGVPFYAIYSAVRSVYKRAKGTIHQDRAMFAQHLVRDAMPLLTIRAGSVEVAEPGCRRAQALMALLCGELELKEPNGNVANYPKTMSALMHPDGWDRVSAALSASVITDAGNGRAIAP